MSADEGEAKEEENLTRELKSEIERLQKRMAELEKLEEALAGVRMTAPSSV